MPVGLKAARMVKDSFQLWPSLLEAAFEMPAKVKEESRDGSAGRKAALQKGRQAQ